MASTLPTLTNKILSTMVDKDAGYIGGMSFDRIMAVLTSVFISGLYLDGWAHTHGLVDKTFFTPWHAVLYSGYGINALVLVATLLINHSRGRSWQTALPSGYELSLLGVPLFLIGGIGDLIWHTLFGFEVGIDPLLSPTHLVLASSSLLIMSGPFRAAWQRSDRGLVHNWTNLLPALISLIAILSIFSFFTQFAHPYTNTGAVTDYPYSNANGSRGAAGVLLQTGILMGLILLVLRRWRLPVGTMTLVFTANIALMSVLKDQELFLPVVILAGVLCDLLLWRLKPSPKRPDALRLFAFAVPVIFYLNYFVPIILHNGGISWTIHLWLGVTIMAGLLGLLLSYLVVPLQMPVEDVSNE